MRPFTHDDLDPLIPMITRLAAHDTTYRIFGSSVHRYRRTPVQEPSINALERVIGTALPSTYRMMLEHLGAGAGPYYGLWSPAEVLAEWQYCCADYHEGMQALVSPAHPFPFTTVHLHQFATLEHTHHAMPLHGSWPCDGCLPIGHQGDTFWSILVTEGVLAGTMWTVANFTGYTGLFVPADHPPGLIGSTQPGHRLPPVARPLRVEEWYRSWLEQAIADLNL